MFLLIDNYDSFTYNLVHFLGELGIEVEVRRNDVVSVDEALALKPEAIVISPGPGVPERAGICLDLVARAGERQLPVLGVCLGHQVIGQAFGGKIIRAPKPMHGKVDDIRHNGTDVFQGLPNPLVATRYHSLVVAAQTLPDVLAVTAQTADGLIMGLAHKELPVHGVQFHPESIATVAGHNLLANFIELATGKPVEGYGTESRAGEMVAL
ncbi:MAG: aminodeoxychorismate/anthranilate synthase component II [Alphaproteobacteria bacterium]|nr:aminodeoxychorismate/anthranilate synthase component II [Alphaproteobacteria bacterium]MCZ6590091.1 aminodeoxychorismate/anthranilate synthase component II [Alphaproteobacteria bacterium]